MRLIKKTEEYRVDTEEAAVDLINEIKAGQGSYEVTKSGYTMKTKKQKGEVIDLWYVVSVTMNYDLGDPQ